MKYLLLFVLLFPLIANATEVRQFPPASDYEVHCTLFGHAGGFNITERVSALKVIVMGTETMLTFNTSSCIFGECNRKDTVFVPIRHCKVKILR